MAHLAGKEFVFKGLREFRFFAFRLKFASTWRHNFTGHFLQQGWCTQVPAKRSSRPRTELVFTIMQPKAGYSFCCKVLLRSYTRFELPSWRCLDNSKIFQKRHIQRNSLEGGQMALLCHSLNQETQSRTEAFFYRSGLWEPHPWGTKNSHSSLLQTLQGRVTIRSMKENRLFLLCHTHGSDWKGAATGRSCKWEEKAPPQL